MPTGVLKQITILLLVVFISAVVWEYRQTMQLTPAYGTVTRIEVLHPGRGGDNREFRIEYSVNG